MKDGSFVAVWAESSASDYEFGTSIRCQFFNADGTKRGKEFRVSRASDQDQTQPAVTVLNDGRFVAAWDSDENGIVARVFQPNGTPIGLPFDVSKTDATYPSLTPLSNGGFALTYLELAISEDVFKTRVFGPSLESIGDARIVNTSTLKSTSTTSLASLQDKYLALLVDHEENRLLGRIFNNDASPPSSSKDFLIVTSGEFGGDIVTTTLSDGRVLAAWESSRDVGMPTERDVIIGQILNPDGTRSGNEMVLSASGMAECFAPVLAASPQGGFTLAYMNRAGDGASLRVAAFDEHGSRTGKDLVIDKSSYWAGDDPSITALADGRVIVAWDKYINGKRLTDIFAQAVDPRQKAVELEGTSAKDYYFGTRFDDTLAGGARSDHLSGKAGSDMLRGGVGNDELSGGSGRDMFLFDAEPNKSTNVDRINDFNPRYDAIWLEDSVFTTLGTGLISEPLKFKADMFVKRAKAQDREDRIFYDSKSGALFYDQDGTGLKAQVKIATLSKGLNLSYADFFVT